MQPKDAIELGRKHNALMVDLKFCDLLGQWQHTSVPFHRLTEDAFEDGFGFDGSSIRGWKAINESDMLLLPEGGTARMDPFMAQPTLSLICNVVDPITRQPYGRDPRYIARKAEAYLKSTNIADTIYCRSLNSTYATAEQRVVRRGRTQYESEDETEKLHAQSH